MINYTIDYFYSIKEKIINNNNYDDYNNKINDLVKKYDCFNNKPTQISNNRFNKDKYYNNRNFKNKYYSKNNFKTIEKKKPSKTDQQLILSKFNKISNNNYQQISKEIINILNDTNYEIVIDKLFEISYKQTNYYDIYENIYKLLLSHDNTLLFEKMNLFLLTKINSIILNLNGDMTLIVKHIDKNELKYDEFCDINKSSKYLKGKIFVISKLINNQIIDIDKDFFVNNIFKYENYNNEIYLELLQIINNNIGLTEKKIEILGDYIEKTDFKGKYIIKFKIKDIIENKNIKII